MVLQFRKFLTIEHVPRITDFCICMYVFGCKLSLFRLCGSDFGITAVDDIAIGIIWAVYPFHTAHISFASSWYLFCLSVFVLARLCVFGTAMSIKRVFFVFLFMKVMSGRFKCIVLSVIIIIIIIISLFDDFLFQFNQPRWVIFITTNKCAIDMITVYITAMYNLYCNMFRHFHIIRDVTSAPR